MNAKALNQKQQYIALGVLGSVLLLLLAFQVMPLLIGGSAAPAAPPTAPVSTPSKATPAAAEAALATQQTPPARAQAPRRSAAVTAAAAREDVARAAAQGHVDPVHLDWLTREAPEPVEGRRNPFSLAPPPPPPSSAANGGPGGPGGGVPAPVTEPMIPAGPPPPPPVPPITMKFIGVVSGPNKVGRLAALSDGKFVYYGREGDVIEGRYRIVKIAEESLQIEYADGRGRQTIRLTGK